MLSHAVAGVMKRPFKARGANIPFRLLERAANIDRREGRIGPVGPVSAMPAVKHNARELQDAAMQRALEIAKPETTSREYDLLIGLSGPPSRDELALLDTIDRTFRAALREHAAALRAKKTETRDPDIDYQILWWLAAGRSQRKIAKHFKIKQPLVARIKRTRLQNIYAAVIDQVIPKVTRAAPAGIKDSKSTNHFGNFTAYEAEQMNYRSYGREDTIGESEKNGTLKTWP